MAEHHSMDECEDGGIGTDAEGQGENGRGGEAGSFRKLTDGKASVLDKLLEPGPAPGFAGFLSDRSGIAESAHGGGASFGWAHATGDVFGDLLVEVELNLPVQFVRDLVTAE